MFCSAKNAGSKKKVVSPMAISEKRRIEQVDKEILYAVPVTMIADENQ